MKNYCNGVGVKKNRVFDRVVALEFFLFFNDFL